VHEPDAVLRSEYDSWHAVAADAPDAHRHGEYISWLLGILDAPSGARILDVACGRGEFLHYASKHGLQVVGVDLSPVAIDAARARLGGDAELHLGSGEQLPFDDDSFEYVTCLGSLEHFTDPLQGAREIARVLRPDGTALVLVPNLFFLGHVWLGLRHGTQPSEGNQQFSEMFLTSEGWRDLLERGGLRIRSLHTWNFVHASRKVSPTTMRVWNALARFIPKNASLYFAFECSVGPAQGAADRA
jgi:SAM-dependent methyltransferase